MNFEIVPSLTGRYIYIRTTRGSDIVTIGPQYITNSDKKYSFTLYLHRYQRKKLKVIGVDLI